MVGDISRFYGSTFELNIESMTDEMEFYASSNESISRQGSLYCPIEYPFRITSNTSIFHAVNPFMYPSVTIAEGRSIVLIIQIQRPRNLESQFQCKAVIIIKDTFVKVSTSSNQKSVFKYQNSDSSSKDQQNQLTERMSNIANTWRRQQEELLEAKKGRMG